MNNNGIRGGNTFARADAARCSDSDNDSCDDRDGDSDNIIVSINKMKLTEFATFVDFDDD